MLSMKASRGGRGPTLVASPVVRTATSAIPHSPPAWQAIFVRELQRRANAFACLRRPPYCCFGCNWIGCDWALACDGGFGGGLSWGSRSCGGLGLALATFGAAGAGFFARGSSEGFSPGLATTRRAICSWLAFNCSMARAFSTADRSWLALSCSTPCSRVAMSCVMVCSVCASSGDIGAGVGAASCVAARGAGWTDPASTAANWTPDGPGAEVGALADGGGDIDANCGVQRAIDDLAASPYGVCAA